MARKRIHITYAGWENNPDAKTFCGIKIHNRKKPWENTPPESIQKECGNCVRTKEYKRTE